MSKPIRPQDIAAAKIAHIPAAVFDAFNAEISTRFNGKRAEVNQETVLRRLEQSGVSRLEVMTHGWLNVADAYRQAGWDVEYDKPAYNEPGEPWFRFTVRGAVNSSVPQVKP